MKKSFFLLLILFCALLCRAEFLHFDDAYNRFYFDKKTGGLRGIYSKTTEKFLVTKGAPRGIFELSLKKTGYVSPKSVRKISAEDCKLLSQKTEKKDGSTTLFQSYLLPDQKSRIDLKIVFDKKNYSSWQICSIENRSGEEIFETAFPIIAGIAPLEGGEQLFRGGAYYILSNPFKYGLLQDAFPSRAPFPVLDMYGKDGRGGVFLIDLDRTRQRTVLCTRSNGRKMLFIKTVKIPHATKYTPSSRTLVGTHTGKWHTAGAIYRDFLASGKNHVQHPEWLANCHGYYAQGWGPRPRFSDIPFWSNAMKEESGMNFIFYFNLRHRWLTQTPAPHLGTYEDLKWAIRKLRRNKLYFGYYNLANSLHPMVDREFLPEKPFQMGSFKRPVFDSHDFLEPGTALRDSIKNIDGSVIFEWTALKKPFDLTLKNRRRMYAHPGALRLCLEQPAVQRYFTGMAQRFAKAGLDVFYWDTVGCGNHNCFDPSHRHGYGTYADGEAKYLADSFKIAKKYNPDAAFMYESINCTTGTCNGYLSTVHSFPAAIRFISPENIGMLGNANHPKDLLGSYLESFRCGMRLGGYNEWWENDKNWVRLQKTNAGMLALRKKVGEFLYPARFMDSLGVHCSGKEVNAGLFASQDQQLMIANIINRNEEKNTQVTITAEAFQKAKYAYVVKYPGTEFEKMPFKKTGKSICFTAPSALASSVLFLNHPEIAASVESVNGAPGGKVLVKVRLRNLSPRNISGEAALEVPKEWGKVKAQKFVISRELEEKVLTFEIPVPRAAKTGRYNIHAQIKTAQKSIRRWELCFIEEPVRVDLEQYHSDKVKIKLCNMTDIRQEFNLNITGMEKSAFAGSQKKITLKPGEKTEQFFEIPGLSDMQSPFRVKVETHGSGWQDYFVETFWPLIANGNLELSNFNDWLPDYWWIANPERSKYPKLDWFAWTKDGGINNTRALKISGGSKHQYSLTPVGPLKPGKTYRFSFFARSTAPCDATVSCIGAVEHAERETFSDSDKKAVKRRVNFSVALKLDNKQIGKWKKYSVTFTVPHDMKMFSRYKGFANIYFTNRTPGATVFFDNVRLVPFNGNQSGSGK